MPLTTENGNWEAGNLYELVFDAALLCDGKSLQNRALSRRAMLAEGCLEPLPVPVKQSQPMEMSAFLP